MLLVPQGNTPCPTPEPRKPRSPGAKSPAQKEPGAKSPAQRALCWAVLQGGQVAAVGAHGPLQQGRGLLGHLAGAQGPGRPQVPSAPGPDLLELIDAGLQLGEVLGLSHMSL